MIELFSIISGLHVEEIKTLKGSFKKVNDDENLYLEELYSIISSANGELISDRELSIAIYGQEKLAAIAKLKSRLFQFLLEILSSNAILSKEQLFDNSAHQIIRVRKKMLQFRVLYTKKNKAEMSVLLHLLSEIIKEAKECEQYDVLVEAMFFKKTQLMVKDGFAEIKSIDKQIDLYHYAHKALLKASGYYFELIVNQDLVSRKSSDGIKLFLRESIIEMEEFINVTNSVFIKYICKLFQLEELLRDNKHDVSLDVCLDILNILKKHKHLYRNERVGAVYNNISICQVYKNNFNDSIVSAQKALEYYTSGGFNFMITQEQEFIACFHGSSYTRANSIIEELLKFPTINKGEFRHDKYLFFQAATLFKLGEHKKALFICNQALEIAKDKGRWDLGIRYLRLMSLVEILEYDQAYSAIEALRKTIGRNKNEVSLRDELIYRAFNEFSSTGFSPTPTNKLIEIIQNLSEKDSVNSWNYYTHELIPIHKWIESKIVSKKNAPTSYVQR